LRIDFRVAGLGDSWMRFMALATLSRIRSSEKYVAYPPHVLVPLARAVFEGYFEVAYDGPSDIEMSHLGIRHLLPGLLAGKRYYSPFHWILRTTRAETTVKDKINDLGFMIAGATKRLTRPSRHLVHEYQGFMELQGLRPFRTVSLEEYLEAAPFDLAKIDKRISAMFPSEGCSSRVVVFPSGSAHQIMPPQVAADLLPSAQFAFHAKDTFAQEYIDLGLDVLRFGNPPGEICELIASSSVTICTDSFPFHLAQMWKEKAILLMTEMKARMTVRPGFPISRIVDSRAPCHPCRHMVRIDKDSRCAKGRLYCATWESPEYLVQISKVRDHFDVPT